MKTLAYGNKTIAYSLERVDRSTMAITVKPDLRVMVRAPLNAEDTAIERIMRKRAGWILRQQRFFAQFLPRTPVRQYVSGETHLYLGKQYRLRIRQEKLEAVKLLGGYLYVYTAEPSNTGRVKELLEMWYVEHARKRFAERVAACLERFAGESIPLPKLHLRWMTRRWGSYSPSGILTLNLDLIRAASVCIDYVIAHELCHSCYRNHSSAFYKLLTGVMPDWQERKLRLEKLLS